jgi:uncharacterized protein (TIGR03083 family)
MTVDALHGLRANHEDLQAVLAALTADQWSLDSACAGWRVQDVLGHVTSNFKEMVEPSSLPEQPTAEGVAVVPAEVMMERLLEPRRTWSPAELLAEYDRYREPAFAALEAMQSEPLASTPVPLSDLGTYPMHQLAEAYCFDHYCHLRHDLLQPAGPLADELPPTDDLRLRPGIDWMLAGLPQMCATTLTVMDRPLRLTLSGPGGGTWVLHPPGDDGLVTVVEGDGDAAAEVRSSAHDFVSWGTRRSDWRAACALSGDERYAATVLDAVDVI